VDVDAVIRRERRGRLRRRGVFGAVAVVAAGAIAVVSLPDRHEALPGPGLQPGAAPSSTSAATPATIEEAAAQAAAAFRTHFPTATIVSAQPAQPPPGGRQFVAVLAKDVDSAELQVSAIRPAASLGAANPCTLKPGQEPGRQGAPRPDDVCSSYSQPDGSIVWIRLTNQPASPGHAPHTVVTVEHIRPDGVVVSLTPRSTTR